MEARIKKATDIVATKVKKGGATILLKKNGG